MFAGESLHDRIQFLHRAFFADLATAIAAAEISDDPYLELEHSIACFAGDGSPLTQANGRYLDSEIHEINRFYKGRAASWEAMLTPFTGASTLERLLACGGKPEAWENVLFRPTSTPLPDWETPSEVEVVEIGHDQRELWSELSTRGFSFEQDSDAARALNRLLAHANVRRYLATYRGEPAAVGAMNVWNNVAFLGGGSTLPEFRGKGLQLALIRRRIREAAPLADVAIVAARATSPSHRNAERAGFQIAHAQLSVRMPTPE